MKSFQLLPIPSTHLKTCNEAPTLGPSQHLTESFHNQNEQGESGSPLPQPPRTLEKTGPSAINENKEGFHGNTPFYLSIHLYPNPI